MSSNASSRPLRALIAGGGVAGLEAALALRELAGDRVAVTMLSPEPDFVYRPLRVREPFGEPAARRYPLAEIADDLGVELHRDAFAWLDAERKMVHTTGGDALAYDALLLAMGARLQAHFPHALTLDDRLLDEQLHGLIQDIEGGYVHKIAFISPSRMPWPLPMYELALMTARRAWEMNEDVSVTIVTPEKAPLALFGGPASEAVARLLEENGILVISSTHAANPQPGQVELLPGDRTLFVDRIVALPELFGPSTPGVPKRGSHGFIPVDAHCRVPGLENTFAAGDAVDFAVKHGGVSSQQADVAAEGIAALAGAPVIPSKLDPVIHGLLLGSDRPLYLSAHLTGGHGSSSQASYEPPWAPGAKIDARYLAPYLDARDRVRVP